MTKNSNVHLDIPQEMKHCLFGSLIILSQHRALQQVTKVYLPRTRLASGVSCHKEEASRLIL